MFYDFNNQPLKHRLYGKAALTAHKKICKVHRAIVPVMPQEEDILKFGGWRKTQRLPFVIYADFEALLLPIFPGPVVLYVHRDHHVTEM
jgi:hypothetical protein